MTSDLVIETEQVGSIPRPLYVLEALGALRMGRISAEDYEKAVERARAETIAELEATGSSIVSDGEQSKPSFVTYAIDGLPNLTPEGFVIEFEGGHSRQLPYLTEGPFRYANYSGAFVAAARLHTQLPLKQAVIAPSAVSLIYPESGIPGYPREAFLADLVDECEKDMRSAFAAGAEIVQLDFTEGRLSCKLDPSRELLRKFIDLNNAVLDRFTETERRKIGIHTCPGGDHNTRHSADVDYAELLPDLFRIRAGRFYIQLASEQDRPRVLDIIRRECRPDQMIFGGVIDPCDMRIETPETVCERTLEVADALEGIRFGTTDDCGFAPFRDDVAMARVSAFSKIRSRVKGTALAAAALGRAKSKGLGQAVKAPAATPEPRRDPHAA